jgi:DnaJ-domain-containing protein 1
MDYFALLDEPRKPWIDTGLLKDKFMEMSARYHPDKFPQATPEERERISARYAELNAAYQCLSHTRDRLLHLIELETGKPPSDVQRIPPGTSDLFMQIGQTCAQAAAFLEKQPQTDSPILKAKRFVEQMEWTDKLTDFQNQLQEINDKLEEELKRMNTDMENGAPLPLERLEEIYRSTSYINRWTDQIREKIVQLAV